MWNTFRLKRATIASQAALSFWRHRSMSSASEGVAVPFCNDVQASKEPRRPARDGRLRGWNRDDSGCEPKGSNLPELLQLGATRLLPRAVPVAAHFLRRVGQPVL